MSNPLSQNILATICYYDVLDYPLTVFELWKYLINNDGVEIFVPEKKTLMLIDIINELESEELKKKIENYQGFYYLSGRKKLVAQRLNRNKISEKKYRIVRRAVWFLRFAPFVRGIAVVGRLAMKNAESQSDLDLLIILRKEHIFTGRFFVTLIVQLLGIRRHGNKIANRICLNHFLTDEFCVSVKDIFSAHEYASALPIFVPEIFWDFYQKNAWIKKYKINYLPESSNLKIIKDNLISHKIRNFLEKCLAFSVFENFLQKMQTNKITKNVLTDKKGAMIICNSDELAFWPNFENQGPRVFEEFKERMKNFS